MRPKEHPESNALANKEADFACYLGANNKKRMLNQCGEKARPLGTILANMVRPPVVLTTFLASMEVSLRVGLTLIWRLKAWRILLPFYFF